VAVRRATGLLGGQTDLAEGLGYSLKRRLLGRPLINEQLTEQRLSKPLALGVLSCDGISSAAYGTEEMLIELLPAFGMAGFALILPMTGVVLLGIALVVLLYREVVSVYTRAGGSYVVARENFGPRIAQVAAVALLIDYIVTVAVQVAAGSAAIVSAFPALGSDGVTIISVVAILIMCYGNLRGIREAGRSFALPTYLFSGAVVIMIITGLYRETLGGGLPRAHPAPPGPNGTYPIGHHAGGLIAFGAVYVLARAFANGGSSLTGIEAVSNAVSALKRPEGRNARQILVTQGSIVAFLIAGISWIAHVTHATPYQSGFPTVLSQEADLIFGHSVLGRVLFFGVQAGTATILFTGGNTSFSGFPFLASFVAEDSFLPRWLTKRGHRLVFSSGIIALTVISLTLGLAVGFNVNHLIPFYAIGVFTGFSMAGFGMASYHRRHKGPGWRRHRAISMIGAVYTALVVLIFAVVKFTEGAWLVVIVFPVMVYVLIRLNREYRMEAQVLERIGSRAKPPEPPTYPRRTVFVFVDDFDLATVAALRYARSLRPTTLRAVHFVIDNVQAETLRQDWVRANTGVVLDFVECADRRLARCAAELVSAEASLPGVGVTAILPRRSYSPLLGRLLHDRTADKIAAVVSRIPYAVATIVPFDVRDRLQAIQDRRAAAQDQKMPEPAAKTPETGAKTPEAGAKTPETGAKTPETGAKTPETGARKPEAGARKPEADARKPEAGVKAPEAGDAAQVPAGTGAEGHDEAADAEHMAGPEIAVADAAAASAGEVDGGQYDRPAPPPGVRPIGTLTGPSRATVEGRVYAVEIRPVERNTVLAAEIADSTGQLTALFYGRSHIPGLECGARIRFRGQVGMRTGGPVMINPAYELVAHGAPGQASARPAGDEDPPRGDPPKRRGPRRRKGT
jgi:amino acid transporter